eukprot:s1687_g16.t1
MADQYERSRAEMNNPAVVIAQSMFFTGPGRAKRGPPAPEMSGLTTPLDTDETMGQQEQIPTNPQVPPTQPLVQLLILEDHTAAQATAAGLGFNINDPAQAVVRPEIFGMVVQLESAIKTVHDHTFSCQKELQFMVADNRAAQKHAAGLQLVTTGWPNGLAPQQREYMLGWMLGNTPEIVTYLQARGLLAQNYDHTALSPNGYASFWFNVLSTDPVTGKRLIILWKTLTLMMQTEERDFKPDHTAWARLFYEEKGRTFKGRLEVVQEFAAILNGPPVEKDGGEETLWAEKWNQTVATAGGTGTEFGRGRKHWSQALLHQSSFSPYPFELEFVGVDKVAFVWDELCDKCNQPNEKVGSYEVATFCQYNGQKRPQGNRSSIRKPVLALCKVTRADGAAEVTETLKAALLEAERANEPVDGGLLGMAAAQEAGRLGLKDLLATLCAYSWPRLSSCGGREVAELAAAASKCGCDDERFFYFVATYCSQNPNAFTCLRDRAGAKGQRDVALVAAALTRKLDSQVNLGAAFHGLSTVALHHLRGTLTGQPIRDIAEFFYSLMNVLGLPDNASLCAADMVSEVILAIASAIRRFLHTASGQDIAKARERSTGLCPRPWDQQQKPFLNPVKIRALLVAAPFLGGGCALLWLGGRKVDSKPGVHAMTGATPNTSFIPKLQIKQQVVSSSPTFTTSHAPSLMTSRPIIKSTPSQGIASPRNVYRTVKTSRKASGAAALVGPVSSVSKGSPSAAPATGTTPAILTFGDSLTHGWTVQGGQPKPYGVFLAQLLGVQRESVVCAGKAGQKAAEMASRLASELSRGCHFDGHAAATAASIEEKLLLQYGQDKMRRNQAMKRPFDVVVVLGGTNDVRTGASPEAVLSHLSVLHQLVRGCGAHCVAVTVPPCGQNGRTIAAVRQAVNDGLRMASRGSNLVVADFDAAACLKV